MVQLTHKLILASASSVRAQMLAQVGLPFEVIPASGYDESSLKEITPPLSPADLALRLASGKAAWVSTIHPDALVIGADQVCALDNQRLSKPETPERAFAQLTQLSGQTHQQHSAVSLFHNGQCLWETCTTARLTMRTLTSSEIQAYIARDNPLSSCGAYLFERHGKHLFAHVEGTDDVIQGLPMIALLNALYDRKLLSLSHTS